MFNPDLCTLCGDCLVDCQWMEVARFEAIDWMRALIDGKHAPVLDRCITCYACNETCPFDANPFDRIAELQEKFQTGVTPEQVAATEANFVFGGELRAIPPAERILSACVFGKSDANLIEGSLYDLPRVGGKPYFCWLLFSHMGAESVQRKHAETFVSRLAATGAKEIVCFHDDCYAMLARYAPDYGIEVPFRPVHLFEHLVEGLRANRSSLRRLELRVAYQRPCASRHTPQKEPFLDELFDLCGVTRVERSYDRERALCCGGVKTLLGQGEPDAEQEKNVLDAKKAGAAAMVYLCPMCRNSLAATARAHDLPMIFVGDLARAALGEITLPVSGSACGSGE